MALADDLSAGPLATMAHAANLAIESKGYALTNRDNVLIGLALKIYSAFRCLIDDARPGRSEAMHHLKTMVESFIYFHLVRSDLSTSMAMRIMAEVFYRKRLFHLRNRETVDPEDMEFWDNSFQEMEAKQIERIGKTSLEALATAHSSGLRSWYDSVYTAACEPAHITDLLDFLPGDGPISLEGNPFAYLDARVALDRGIDIVLQLANIANTENAVGLTIDSLAAYEARFSAIRRGDGTQKEGA